MDKQVKARRKYFKSFCSKTLADWIIQDKTFTIKEKNEILKIAKKIAFRNGHLRIWFDDFRYALREWRKKNV